MNKELNNKILRKICENCNFAKKKGMIIASPSNDPPYKYHWIRDSALVMRVMISEYEKYKDDKSLIYILNYIENEYDIQNLKTLTGLGEPKINIDCTPYNDPWGRPQNDGPALRCINLLKIYKLLKNDYQNIIEKIVITMIEKDIKYIIENYNNICFDLWEEIKGWHFYTRVVQLKCIKEYILLKKELDEYFKINIDIEKLYKSFLHNTKDHIEENGGYISSFDINGNIIRKNDASIILAFCHISFDKEILSYLPIEKAIINSNNLMDFFKNKYNEHKMNFIGRYENDKYYNGHIWILCSLAIGQFFQFLSKNFEKYKKMSEIPEKIYSDIISIDDELNLSEQYDIRNKKHLSANKLTWNYSEFYFFLLNH